MKIISLIAAGFVVFLIAFNSKQIKDYIDVEAPASDTLVRSDLDRSEIASPEIDSPETAKVTFFDPEIQRLNDSVYIYETGGFYTIERTKSRTYLEDKTNASASDISLEEPIELDWDLLLDIEYELRYFPEHDVEAYSPIFTKALKAYHEKTVILEGFVIPIDETNDMLALSMNPFASCFFCGNASPASVTSLYLKENTKKYKTDDFVKFKATLYLNKDDLKDFYYILRDAEEVK